jgi:MFS family permease
MMLFSLYAGTLVDKFPKRKMLIFTQSSLAILAVVLASLTYLEFVKYWHVLVLALLLGTVNTLDMPTRQSFFIELVGKEDLMNAIALNSTIFNLARIIGPATAGLLIGIVGIGICFYINALSFIAVITSLWMINVPIRETVRPNIHSFKNATNDIREGLIYIGKNIFIKYPLMLLAFISLFLLNFNVLIPVYAQQNLNQNAAGYGFLMTSMGIGSFVAALTLAALSKAGPSLKYLICGAFGSSIFMVLLGLEDNYLLACLILFVIGFSMIVFTALVNTTIQLKSDDCIRGRVMSVYAFVFGGVTPIGSLLAGNITEYAGAPTYMFISGIIGIAATFYTLFVLRKHLGEKIKE